MIRQYATPLAFKEALEARLRALAAREGRTVNRLRQVLVMERLLARIGHEADDVAILKGGLALELRSASARATRDVDLRIGGSADRVRSRLQRAARQDQGDFLSFEVVVDPEHPLIEAEGLPYKGLRFRAEASLAGRRYGEPFGVDVALAEPVVMEPEPLQGSDLLSFVGLPRPVFMACPAVVHVAEELHAYTIPRPHPNSRVKDLPDMALLASLGPVEAASLRAAIEATFRSRATHPVPERLPEPPGFWAVPYARMAGDQRLAWRDLEAVTVAARAFVDPVLAGRDGVWKPAAWGWDG